jgi:hypothetical protein
MINKLDALHSLRPTGVWGDTSGKFGCDEGITLPTDAEIDAEVIRLQAVYDSQEYARARATEYSALNQFEMQFDDQQNNTTTWVDAINDIKAAHPKP